MQRQPQRSRIFPTSRYLNFKHYYAFGNSPAEDFLQSIAACECRRPTILSLGCGDMRSCMYTIWKNFGFEGENTNGFNGVDFVLNDYNASVLARNILFLYLCMCMPDNEVNRKEWIASMWSLWYNHELQPQHATMLSDALAQLVQWSHTWQEWSECPLGGVVRFSSPATFATVKMVWENWLQKCLMEWRSVNEVKMERSEFQCHQLKNSGLKGTREELLKLIVMADMIQGNSFGLPKRICTTEKEYLYYLKEGTVWAEIVLDIPSSFSHTVSNPTLYERADGLYSLHYSLTPYSGFIQTFQYTHAEVCRTFGKHNSLLQLLPVADCHFENMPLLANSVQQFTMWLVATARMMKKSSGSKISFTFDFDDAITLCSSLLNQSETFIESGLKGTQFDVIYTSNLFDHLSPPALVLSALPLLKSDGTLFSATFRYKEVASNTSKYLEKIFGISPAFFPTLLGIRCLGHDGQYSPAVNPEPRQEILCPLHITLLWKNIEILPYVSDDFGELLRKWCTSGSLFSTLTSGVFAIENFLIVLHHFLGKFQPKKHLSHHILEPLCTAIRRDSSLTSRLLQLQTQSLLHGVHMHITLTEDNCPLCRGQPLETYLQQFTVSFDFSNKSHIYDSPIFSINLASFTGDVALVTSLACRSVGPTLALDFFLPKQCLSQYKIFSVNMHRGKQKEIAIVGSMYDLLTSKTEYVFLKQNMQPCATDKRRSITCPLGSIVKHIGDECTFETVVSMNEACSMAMKKSKLDAKCNESNQVTLICGTLSAKLVYPYAINESKACIKISKKRNIIFVTVEREDNVFYREKPTFYIDSSNKLALPRFQCNIDVMDIYCMLQTPINYPDHPFLKIKHCFTELFKHALSGEEYFTLSFPKKSVAGTRPVRAIVYVHDIRFCTAFSSPVFDVSYCFLDENPIHVSLDYFTMRNPFDPVWSLRVNDAEYELLKEIFKYFSTVTCCAFSSERHTVTLPVEKHRLWKYFDHAILFPLYPNPANPNIQSRIPILGSIATSQELLTLLASEIMSSCTFCGKISTALKKCERCRKAEYCGRECQLKHRPIHKSACSASDTLPKNRTPTQNDATSLPQTRQKSRSSDLNISSSSFPAAQHTPLKQSPLHSETMTSTLCKRCKKLADVDCLCKSVSYYGKEYQTLVGPNHEKKCNQPADDSSSIDHKTSTTIPSNLDREYSGYCADKDTAIALESRVCMRCRKPAIITCSCELVWYCSKTCQTLEQAEHNNKCRKILQKASTVVPSSKRRDHSNRSDNDASNNLSTVCIRCKKPATIKCLCKSVSYCSSACQTLEWPEHGKTCSSSEKKSHKPSPVVPSNKGKGHGGCSETKSSSALNSVSKVCMRCKKPATINCSCKLVSYCSKACQTLEWSEHSQECIPPVKKLHKTPPVISSSKGQDHGNCFESDASNSASSVCMRCKKAATIHCVCRSVSYCSRACQTLEWPEHSEKCNSPHEKLQKPSPVVPKSKGKYHSSGSESDASNSVNTLCMRCKKPTTIRCSCRSMSYCSKACQTLEWPEHSKKCSPPVNRSSLTDPSCKDPHPPCSKDSREPIATHNLKCSNCNKAKSQLKRCKCHNVSYCSVECQRLHWPQHKHICSAVRK